MVSITLRTYGNLQRNYKALELRHEELQNKYNLLEESQERLREALDELCEEYIGNPDTEFEFLVCITSRDMPEYWTKAREALNHTPKTK